MTVSVETVSVPRDSVATARALLSLTKPSITRMVLVTTAAGSVAATGPVDLWRLAVTLVGTALVVGAANTLNMYLERDVDAAMERTRARALPSGRLAPEVALLFGVALAISGLLVLSFGVGALAGFLAATALISYVLVYTPLKRVTPLALHVGAVPGAIPPLIGCAGMTGELSVAAWALFSILFVWQLPHFLAISLFRKAEYERAGLRVYAAVRGPERTRGAIVVYSLLLVLVSLVPAFLGVGGLGYALCATGVGVVFTGVALRGLRAVGVEATERWARGVFFASLPHLVLVYGCLVAVAS